MLTSWYHENQHIKTKFLLSHVVLTGILKHSFKLPSVINDNGNVINEGRRRIMTKERQVYLALENTGYAKGSQDQRIWPINYWVKLLVPFDMSWSGEAIVAKFLKHLKLIYYT